MVAKTDVQEAGEILTERGDSFMTLARRIAMGEQVGSTAIADILRDAGKLPPQLDDLVANLKYRAKLREQAAQKQTLEARRDAQQRELDTANDKLDAAVAEHRRTAGAIQLELAELNLTIAKIATIDADLARSCPNTALQRDFRALDSEIMALYPAIRDAQDAVDRALNNLQGCDPADREGCQTYLDATRERHSQIQAEQAAKSRRHNELHQQMAEW
ncbi:MAG: hypothetical protein K8T25_18085 [Planctomycetia bacterium]|nr:hypothetical protein [Planctomycetia bacterium]